MKSLVLHININPNLYGKDPQTTRLGRRIISESVLMMDQIGLEQFTFRKLAKNLGSTETSVYRYFDNKHQLFVYLLNWYWEWIIARMEINTLNISDPKQQLKIVLGVIVDASKRNMDVEFVDEEALVRIVVREGTKGYHHKMVKEDNEEGYFLAYKRLCEKIAAIILKINGTFPYPRTLSTMLIEAAQNNIFNAKFLPRLTDLKKEEENLTDKVKEMLEFMALGLIEKNGETLNPSYSQKSTN